MNHWKRVTRWLSTPPYDQEIAAYCQQFGFSRAHSALAACEGLLLASTFSVLFWSALTFVLFRLG